VAPPLRPPFPPLRALTPSPHPCPSAPPPGCPSEKHTELLLNFAIPHRSLVNKKEVKRVTVPGRDGALGLEKNSPPLLTELKPGVVRVDYNDSTASEEYFVPGGFAFKHANNVMDVSAPEGVKLDSVDADALRAANAEATKALAAATVGSKAHAEAKIQLELFKVSARGQAGSSARAQQRTPASQQRKQPASQPAKQPQPQTLSPSLLLSATPLPCSCSAGAWQRPEDPNVNRLGL
jgi:F-type H+-transporting ATPase subunit delta